MAGPENPYFREKIQPHVDGSRVEYAGCVRGRERDRLLRGARVLLYPIQFPEAFGLVLVEAMLCGTPVAALGRGAVPEIVEDNVTGAIAPDMQGFQAAVLRALELDRGRVHRQAAERFSPEAMARAYLEVYQQAAR
jgi:glycosyltransferase involved in cell wall biosynthesis